MKDRQAAEIFPRLSDILGSLLSISIWTLNPAETGCVCPLGAGLVLLVLFWLETPEFLRRHVSRGPRFYWHKILSGGPDLWSNSMSAPYLALCLVQFEKPISWLCQPSASSHSTADCRDVGLLCPSFHPGPKTGLQG